ncbi:DHA1 family multidrug resistance protein-like MFS transporter [Paenibacillus shirakamiensis]|uniref:DHA1 family multidrug resistance protein-like MFS transporter n=1 Tax=Paenibacillus shirakamiensis TaxID=1265935 RepID=A0ABS4JE06_9BACL|nr:MFS transporter [Paenibacillus shirakamiensis]MBP1999962.1 DHA1 family multidrug resistance protein-like MFS transporter [Paenibacillus shirakamiensis]
MMPQVAWKQSVRILWGGRFLSSAGLTGISPFIPYYMEHLHAGSAKEVLMWTGLSVSAPALSYALLTPIWGKLGDRWSRKWMVVRALTGLAVSMALMGLAQTPLQFVLFRLCQGAFGGISDASSAFVGTHAPNKHQGTALGHLEKASAAGLLLGPLLGSACVNTWGSRSLLFVTASLTLSFAILAASLLSGGEKASDIKVSLQTNSWSRRQGRNELQRKNGIFQTFLFLLSHSLTRRLVVAGIFFKLVDFATFTMFTPLIREGIPSSPSAVLVIGLLLAMSSLGEFVGSSWWGKRNDRTNPERNLRLAGLLCGLCLLAHSLPISVIGLIVIRFLQGFFFSALLQTVMLNVLRCSTDQDRGVRIGATNSLLMIGQLTGPSLGVWIGGIFGTRAVFIIMGAVMLAISLWICRPAVEEVPPVSVQQPYS